MDQSIQNSCFQYENPTNLDVNDTCNIEIMVKTLQYPTKQEYYEISYKFTFSDFGKFSIFQNDSSEDGEIIKKNEMTQVMIRYLLMSDTDLSKVCGLTSPQNYKIIIMKNLSMLWD